MFDFKFSSVRLKSAKLAEIRVGKDKGGNTVFCSEQSNTVAYQEFVPPQSEAKSKVEEDGVLSGIHEQEQSMQVYQRGDILVVLMACQLKKTFYHRLVIEPLGLE